MSFWKSLVLAEQTTSKTLNEEIVKRDVLLTEYRQAIEKNFQELQAAKQEREDCEKNYRALKVQSSLQEGKIKVLEGELDEIKSYIKGKKAIDEPGK